jgi:hypothetical protein
MSSIFQQNADLNERVNRMSDKYEFAYYIPNPEQIQIKGVGYYFSGDTDFLNFKPVDDNLYTPETAKIKAAVLYSHIKNKEYELFKSGNIMTVQGLYYKVINHYFNDNMNRFLLDEYLVETGISKSLGDLRYSNVQFPRKVRNTNYSIEWFGYFIPDTNGVWTFNVTSDDASYLWIGDYAVNEYNAKNASAYAGNINIGGIHPDIKKSTSIDCIAGKIYPIRVQYGQNGGGATFRMSINAPQRSPSFNNPFKRLYSIIYKNKNTNKISPYEYKNVYFCLKEYTPETTQRKLFHLFILDPNDTDTIAKLKSRNVQNIPGTSNQLQEHILWEGFTPTEPHLVDDKNVAFIDQQGKFAVYRNGQPIKTIGDLELQSIRKCMVRLDSTSNGVEINIYKENVAEYGDSVRREPFVSSGIYNRNVSRGVGRGVGTGTGSSIIEGIENMGSATLPDIALSTISTATPGSSQTTLPGSIFTYPNNPECSKILSENEARCYSDKNPDVKSVYLYDTTQLKNHWQTIGCKQFRSYSCQPKCEIELTDQQASCYMDRYPHEFTGNEGNLAYGKMHWKLVGCKKDYDFSCPWVGENQDSPDTVVLPAKQEYAQPPPRPTFPSNVIKVKTIASIEVTGAVPFYKYVNENLKTFLPSSSKSQISITGNDFNDDVMGINPYNAIRSDDFKYKLTITKTGKLVLLCAKEPRKYNIVDSEGNRIKYTKPDTTERTVNGSENFYFYRVEGVNFQAGHLNYLDHLKKTISLVPPESNLLSYGESYIKLGNYAPYKQFTPELTDTPVDSMQQCENICNKDPNCSMLYYFDIDSQHYCKIVNDKIGFSNKYNSIQPSSNIKNSSLYLRDSNLNIKSENMPIRVPLTYYFEDYPKTDGYLNVPFSDFENRPIGAASSQEYQQLSYNTCRMLYGVNADCRREGFANMWNYKNVTEGLSDTTYDTTPCENTPEGCIANIRDKKISPLEKSFNSYQTRLNATNTQYLEISGNIGEINTLVNTLNGDTKYRFKEADETYLPQDEKETISDVAKKDAVEMMLQQNNINIIGFIATASVLIASIMIAKE